MNALLPHRIFSIIYLVLIAATLPAMAQPACTPPPSGLVDWWPGEGNANDIAGTNNGTLVNGVSFVNGEVGQAFSFNGSDYVSIPDSPSLDQFNTNITIELWLKSNQSGANPDWRGIVTKGNASWRLQAYPGTGTLDFITTGPSNLNLVGNRNVNDGNWHHVAGVYDGTNKYLYVDGTLDVSTPTTGSISQISQPVYIGNTPNAPGNYIFNGLIDEVSLYNRALSASEIQAIYAAGSAGKCNNFEPMIVTQPTDQTLIMGDTATFSVGAIGTQPLSYQWYSNGTNNPIADATNATLLLTNVQPNLSGNNYAVLVTNVYGSILSSNATLTLVSCTPPSSGLVDWWPGEGNAIDIAGSNNGTLTNGVSFAVGEVGQAFSFNGSDYVSIPDSPSLDQFTTNITIELWLKSNQSGANPNWGGIFTKGNASWRLMATTGSDTVDFSTTGLGNVDLEGSRNVNDGQWHHVAAVYDGTYKYLYVDGTLDVATYTTGSISQTTDPVYIGNLANASGNYIFNGLIDEVSLYNRALTASEIQAIYAAGIAGKCNAPFVPMIITQPTNETAMAGDTATFSVSATGSQLDYQWSFDDTNIVGANESTLTITNVALPDLGSYSVVVTNELGTAASSNAMLFLYPFIETPFTGAITYWGNSATLSVGAIGSGQLSYQWYFNGVPIDVATNATLDFTSIQPTNGGLYSVVVSSPYGTITNAAYQVIVNPANVSLGFYPGLTISGVEGYSYIIQSSTNLENTNGWLTLTNLTLTQPVQLWIDTTVDASSPFNQQHFYQILPGQ